MRTVCEGGARWECESVGVIRGKWKVGFLALRDIPEGEELAYDYGLHTEESWTRAGEAGGWEGDKWGGRGCEGRSERGGRD